MWRFGVLVLCLSLMPVTVSAEKPECRPPEGTDTLWQRSDLQFVILGEYHGTAEMPAAFGEMVCSALASGRDVLVGLEFLEEAQQAFETYLASSGDAPDRARLIEAAFTKEIGSNSKAVFELMEQFRQWRQAGLPLSITAFQRKVEYDPAEGQTPHEKGMAASLREAAAQMPDALVLVLVGNIHARKKPYGGDAVPAFVPMAMHLPQEKTLALVAVHKGGTARNCRMLEPGKLDCVPAERRPSVLGRDAPPGLKLGLGPDAAYDGLVKLGEITASLPLNPSPGE